MDPEQREGEGGDQMVTAEAPMAKLVEAEEKKVED